MKLVTQKDYSGCGIACLAMITNSTYDRVKNSVFLGRHRNRGFYTSHTQLIEHLNSKNIQNSGKLVRCPRDFRNLDCTAIIKTNVTKGGYWHWIVWDFAKQRILDPKVKPYLERNLRPKSAIKIYL